MPRSVPPGASGPRPAAERRRYVAEALRLYLAAPDSAQRAHRGDRVVARELHAQGVPLSRLAHAIRLATLRRHLAPTAERRPVQCLAYYRAVLQAIRPDENENHYIDYVRCQYDQLFPGAPVSLEPRAESQNPALSRRR